jgi:hypothetical protein
MKAGRYAVRYPAVAEAARRTGATAVGLVDLGWSAGLNLNVDRVGVSYANRGSLGDPSAPLQRSAAVVGGRPVPTRALPGVVARVGVDPLEVADADAARWLRAWVWPDEPERAARLQAGLALAAAPRLLLQGDPLGRLADAVAWVPGDALAVLTTTGRRRASRPGAAWAFCSARPSGGGPGAGVASAEGSGRAGGPDPWRPPRRWPPRRRPGGVGPLDPARRGGWPLLVAGPLAGLAGRPLGVLSGWSAPT